MPVNITIIITIFIQALLFILVNHYIFILDDFNALKSLLPFINLLMLFLLIFLFISTKKLETTTKRQIEANLLKEHLKQLENVLETMQIQKHEHTKHIQTLQAMVYLNEIEEAQKYIDGIAVNYWYTESIIDTGHPALTALLNSKRKVAEIKNIKFDFSIKCDVANIHLFSWDLCSIIGNLIDNAFEAVTENVGSKNVGLEIKSENKNYVIYVINNGPKLPPSVQEKIFQPGFTTKDSEGRGYGLFLVNKLINKYNGKIQVISNDKTTFIISLPHQGE
ncbi:MAG: ATP-binding protein [Bacillota bacterium]